MIDCHVHSAFSADSTEKAETTCNHAIEIGLEGITFTDHLDLDYPAGDISFLIDFDAYAHYMNGLKREYRDRLKIFMGVEAGYQPQVIQATDSLIRGYDFDFVINSVHAVNGTDPYYGDFYVGKTKYEAYSEYLKAILDSVSAYKNYDVVGHIGYIRRYGNYDDRSLRHLDYKDLLDMILKTVIHDGKGIEINTSGLRSLSSPMPDFDIIKRYLKLGGEIITLGSDAHRAEHIGYEFDAVLDVLKGLGVRRIAHYEGRKAFFDAI